MNFITKLRKSLNWPTSVQQDIVDSEIEMVKRYYKEKIDKENDEFREYARNKNKTCPKCGGHDVDKFVSRVDYSTDFFDNLHSEKVYRNKCNDCHREWDYDEYEYKSFHKEGWRYWFLIDVDNKIKDGTHDNSLIDDICLETVLKIYEGSSKSNKRVFENILTIKNGFIFRSIFD